MQGTSHTTHRALAVVIGTCFMGGAGIGICSPTAGAATLAPLSVLQVGAEIRVTEYTYHANSGEFIEFTNVGAVAVDLTGWSVDDEEAHPGAFDLTPVGVLDPGVSFIVTTALAGDFIADWSMLGVTVLGGNDTAKLSRNDAIHLFDAGGSIIDRLEFGDVNFEYSVRTRDVSAYVCPAALGQDNPYGWRLSSVADSQNSTASADGDIGSPGRYVSAPCEPLALGEGYCLSTLNSTGQRASLVGHGTPFVAANTFRLFAANVPVQTLGYTVMSETQGFVAHPGGSSGNLCLGGTIGRMITTLGPSNAAGEWSASFDLTVVPPPLASQVLAGDSWSFQLWFRDGGPGVTSNFSNGLEVHFH